MSITLKQRLEALEQRVISLQERRREELNSRAWLDSVYGQVDEEPAFAKDVDSKSKPRRTLQPRTAKTRSPK